MPRLARHITALLFLLVCTCLVCAQQEQRRCFRVICYNVENYFDCVDDSVADDSEFLRGGIRGWNYTKYRQKQANIAKAIAAIAAWDTPALIGLCEVESQKALTDLTRYSPLQSFGYKFIHYESPDARGIDVALLYHPYRFFPIASKAVPVVFPGREERTTRDILYVQGTTMYDDTLHVLLNHFPSRFGGEAASEHRRLHAASVLRQLVDSLFHSHSHPNILIMGDFNDYPTDKSICHVLQAAPLPDDSLMEADRLYNLVYRLHTQGKGSHKHQGEWGMLDQIIVSGNLLNRQNRFFTRPQDIYLFDADFLLEPDERYLGQRPFRTYYGMRYQGGFSDHLPVYIDFWYSPDN